MLVKIKEITQPFKPYKNNSLFAVLNIISDNKEEKEIIPGVYEIGHFNFDTILNMIGYKIWNSYNLKGEEIINYYNNKDLGIETEFFSDYGVCDNYEQILEKYKFLSTNDKHYVISITPIIKSEQPITGGWRWHKWGEYIGTKNPQHEYIYDEDDSIEKVYCYHVYQLLNYGEFE